MKRWTWKKLIKIVNRSTKWWDYDSSIYDVLDETPPKYRAALAAALSVAKWHPDRKTLRGDGDCGLCAFLEFTPKGYRETSCDTCPLLKRGNCCNDSGSLWHKASCEIYDKAYYGENTEKLYSLLADIYREEYEKLLKNQ